MSTRSALDRYRPGGGPERSPVGPAPSSRVSSHRVGLEGRLLLGRCGGHLGDPPDRHALYRESFCLYSFTLASVYPKVEYMRGHHGVGERRDAESRSCRAASVRATAPKRGAAMPSGKKGVVLRKPTHNRNLRVNHARISRKASHLRQGNAMHCDFIPSTCASAGGTDRRLARVGRARRANRPVPRGAAARATRTPARCRGT